MSHRARFLLLVAPCLLNCVGMFFVALGAAFGGPQRALLWPALALLVAGVLLLATLSALRAVQIGHSPGLTFVSIVLAAGFGPAVLLPLAHLFFKPEIQPRLQPPSGPGKWLLPLALLALPWAVLACFGLGRRE